MAGGVVLAFVWIGVYWATPPAPSGADQPGIVFADDRSARADAPEPVTVAQDPAPLRRVETPVADPTPLPPTPVAVIPPRFREHTVRANETMETIARTQLGDAALWTAVASANPRIDPLKLRVGQTIRIPLDPTNIQGRPNPEVVAVRPQQSAPEAPARIEYVVRKGDTLGAIARTYYNSSARWQVILDANRDKIARAEDIRPGMTLVIPPAPVTPQ